MSDKIIPQGDKHLASPGGGPALPALVEEAGERTRRSFVEFFVAQIRNKNTRQAYARATRRFFDWCEKRGTRLLEIEPVGAAAYVEELAQKKSKATVKQHRSALVSLFDYLVSKPGPVQFNPVRPVRPPKLKRRRGATPGLRREEILKLFETCEGRTIGGLRDRALFATLLYSCGRVSAVVQMEVQDYFENDEGGRSLHLREKGGKLHRVPAHHQLKQHLSGYIKEGNLRERPGDPLFQSLNRKKQLTGRPLDRRNAWDLIKRKAKKAGIRRKITTHSFRVAGANALLEAGVDLEVVQRVLNHADIRTTKVYDRRSGRVEQSDIERIDFHSSAR